MRLLLIATILLAACGTPDRAPARDTVRVPLNPDSVRHRPLDSAGHVLPAPQ